MNRQRIIGGGIIIASLLITGLFFAPSVHQKHNVGTSPITAQITHPIFTAYDNNGQLNTKLHATMATQHASSNDVYLIHPQALIHNHASDHSSWNIRAETGVWRAQRQVAQMSHHVVAKRTTHDKTILTVIKTERLNYILKKHLLKTNKTVLLKQPGFQAHGTGVTVNLNNKTIRIRQGMQGQYNPAHAVHKVTNDKRRTTP